MWIKRLQIEHFRGRPAQVEFGERQTMLIGPNGAGKSCPVPLHSSHATLGEGCLSVNIGSQNGLLFGPDGVRAAHNHRRLPGTMRANAITAVSAPTGR
jgi:hypothetical protein